MSTLVKFNLTEDDLAKSNYVATSDIDRFLNMGSALGLSEWIWRTPDRYLIDRAGPMRVIEIRFHNDDWGKLFLGLMKVHFPNVIPEIEIPRYDQAFREAVIGIWRKPPPDLVGKHTLREIHLI